MQYFIKKTDFGGCVSHGVDIGNIEARAGDSVTFLQEAKLTTNALACKLLRSFFATLFTKL